MKNLTAIGGLLLLALWAQGAAAATTYQFSAPVFREARADGTIVTDPADRLYEDGTLVSGQFIYDPSATGMPLGDLVSGAPGTFFPLALLDLTGSVDGDHFGDEVGAALQQNEGLPLNGEMKDLFLLLASDFSDDFLGFQRLTDNGVCFELFEVTFIWTEDEEDFFDDDTALLSSLPPGATPNARISLNFFDVHNPDNTRSVFSEPLVVQAVPVPAAVWLFGSALGLLGIARRRTG